MNNTKNQSKNQKLIIVNSERIFMTAFAVLRERESFPAFFKTAFAFVRLVILVEKTGIFLHPERFFRGSFYVVAGKVFRVSHSSK